MNHYLLKKNLEGFHGEKYLKKETNYFEGWYFKNTSKNYTISFIPGISINDEKKEAFIQIITNQKSYYIPYKIEKFQFSNKPFYIKIGDNFFSKNRIRLNIKNEKQKLFLMGELNFSNHIHIKKTIVSPNIMGPFSYIPFMECNHAILSMKHIIDGKLKLNKKKIIFKEDIGYIEKDWGISFPKKYIWIQANQFKKQQASFMVSIANIPFLNFEFTGIICVLIIDGKEYRFTTYNRCELIVYHVEENFIQVILKKGNYYLKIKATTNSNKRLLSPIRGSMEKEILESISAQVEVILRKKDKIIWEDISNNCGLEIVN